MLSATVTVHSFLREEQGQDKHATSSKSTMNKENTDHGSSFLVSAVPNPLVVVISHSLLRRYSQKTMIHIFFYFDKLLVFVAVHFWLATVTLSDHVSVIFNAHDRMFYPAGI